VVGIRGHCAVYQIVRFAQKARKFTLSKHVLNIPFNIGTDLPK